MSVLVVGEALVDVVTNASGRTSRHPGGSPMNVAVGLGRLGVPVQLLTALGDDHDGHLLRCHLEDSAVQLIRCCLPQTSTASAQLDAAGVATYTFALDWRLPTRVPPAPHWLHVGSIAVTQPPGADVVSALRGRTISYDVNCRPSLMGRPEQVRGVIEDQIRRSNVVKLSDEDAAWLWPGQPVEELVAGWLTQGPSLVVVTRGANGASGWTAGCAVHTPTAPGGPVVDTVGAGDAFMAGLIWALMPDDAVAVNEAQLINAMEIAGVVARRTCERAGADPPRLGEVAQTRSLVIPVDGSEPASQGAQHR